MFNVQSVNLTIDSFVFYQPITSSLGVFSERSILLIYKTMKLCISGVIQLESTCLVAEKEARVYEKEAPSVAEISFDTTSKASPSQPSVVLLAVAVSSESLA